MNQLILEWIGYAASILIAISLLMSSIVKLRWLNLIGSLLFSIYGFAIGAMPVGFINLFIIFINLYYLYKIYSEREYFKIIEIGQSDKYLMEFLNYYNNDINHIFPLFQREKLNEDIIGFYILRNLVPAGIFIASKYDDTTLLIEIDFAVPAYQDFKIASYIFNNNREYFLKLGYQRFITYSQDQKHLNYLNKMGFTSSQISGQTMFVKNI
ncbi:hypothetical protein [Alkaliphilus crotonatoxidans]